MGIVLVLYHYLQNNIKKGSPHNEMSFFIFIREYRIGEVHFKISILPVIFWSQKERGLFWSNKHI